MVRVGDVARVELAAQQYSASSAIDGSPSATVAVFQAPNANALSIAASVERHLRALARQFPPGLEYSVAYTEFVRANIHEILLTLIMTLILVVAVVYVFLQDWRATLIPTIAIPVSLIGVFAILYACGEREQAGIIVLPNRVGARRARTLTQRVMEWHAQQSLPFRY